MDGHLPWGNLQTMPLDTDPRGKGREERLQDLSSVYKKVIGLSCGIREKQLKKKNSQKAH